MGRWVGVPGVGGSKSGLAPFVNVVCPFSIIFSPKLIGDILDIEIAWSDPENGQVKVTRPKFCSWWWRLVGPNFGLCWGFRTRSGAKIFQTSSVRIYAFRFWTIPLSPSLAARSEAPQWFAVWRFWGNLTILGGPFSKIFPVHPTVSPSAGLFFAGETPPPRAPTVRDHIYIYTIIILSYLELKKT